PAHARIPGGVRCFEGDGRAPEPESRIVPRAQPDRMLKGIRPVRPLDPEGDRPLAEPTHGCERHDLVVHAVELPRPTDLPGDIRRACDQAVIPIPREILHSSVRCEILHVVEQDRTVRGWQTWSETGNLRSIQGATVDEDFVDDPVEEVVPFTAGGPDLDATRTDRRRR